MNKKEVAEIRRQYVPERCTISRICGCYVDAEKNIKTTMKEAFLSLPEDDAFKYFTIFKKTLSGTVGRNLVNLDFPLEEEHEGGHQELHQGGFSGPVGAKQADEAWSFQIQIEILQRLFPAGVCHTNILNIDFHII